MTTAYILINCDLGSEADIIKKIKNISNVLYVSHVLGVYDIIVRISSDNVEDLRETIKQNIKKIEKVRSTITMVVTDRPGHIK